MSEPNSTTYSTAYCAPARSNSWQESFILFDEGCSAPEARDVEIRKVVCSTNAVESINARDRRAVRTRGHFPTEQAALKCLYLVTRSLDPNRQGQGTMGDQVEPALNAFAVTFEGRITPSTT